MNALTASVRAGTVFVALAGVGCRPEPRGELADRSPEHESRSPEHAPRSEAQDTPCSLAELPCPKGLPHLGPTSVPAEMWAQVDRLAPSGLLAVALRGGEVRLESGCLRSGKYLELAKAPASPGRGWVASRMLFRADERSEVGGCQHATHLVALFARHAARPSGEMLLVPLPCPPDFAAGRPCVATGATPTARKDEAQALALQITELRSRNDGSRHAWDPAFVGAALELAARMPTDVTAAAIREEALRPLRTETHGGCSIAMESTVIARELEGHPETPRRETWLKASASPHFPCQGRPSFAQCMPQTFTPGPGANCWSPHVHRD